MKLWPWILGGVALGLVIVVKDANAENAILTTYKPPPTPLPFGGVPGIGEPFLVDGDKVLVVFESGSLNVLANDLVFSLQKQSFAKDITAQAIQVPPGTDPQVFADALQTQGGIDKTAVIQLVRDDGRLASVLWSTSLKTLSVLLLPKGQDPPLWWPTDAVKLQNKRLNGALIVGDMFFFEDSTPTTELAAGIAADASKLLGIPEPFRV